MLRVGDRVQESVTSYTTSAFTLPGSAATGYRAFSGIPSIVSGDVVPYAATDASGNWEVGYGIYSAGSLARTIISDGTAGAGTATTFSGTVTLFCDHLAALSSSLQTAVPEPVDGARVGEYATVRAALSMVTPATGQLMAAPIYIQPGSPGVKSLGFGVLNSPSTQYTLRAALYRDSGARLKPGALVSGSDTGDIVIPTSAYDAFYKVDVNLGPQTPGLYWLASQCSAGTGNSIRGLNGGLFGSYTQLGALLQMNFRQAYGGQGVSVGGFARTYGAFPSAFETGGTYGYNGISFAVPFIVWG